MEKHLGFVWEDGEFQKLENDLSKEGFGTGILITGKFGVGKTELLESLIDVITQKNEDKRIVYVGIEPDVNGSCKDELIQALKRQSDWVAYDDCKRTEEFPGLLNAKLSGHNVIATITGLSAEGVYNHIETQIIHDGEENYRNEVQLEKDIRTEFNIVLLVERGSDGERIVSVVRGE